MSTIVRRYPSKSNPTRKPYLAQYDPSTGASTCDCPAWINKRADRPRGCKHTADLIASAKSGAVAETVAPVLTAPVAVAPAASSCPADPMLASAMTKGQTLSAFNAAEWILEEKYDGHRIIVETTAGVARCWSRPRAGKTALPRELPAHLLAALTALPDGVWDGELIVDGGKSFDVTRVENRSKLRFVVFDVLSVAVGGARTNCRTFTYDQRRGVLELSLVNVDTAWVFASDAGDLSDDRLAAIFAKGGEGAILKRKASLYRDGARSAEWVKVKRSGAAAFTIIGFEAGSFGPYAKTLLRGDDGLETSVKTKDNATLAAIAKNPEAFLGARLVVSFCERTPSGSLRHGMWDHLAGEGE